MKIERLELIPYALPFREPYVTAKGRLNRREMILVRLHAEGLVGLGEAVPLLLRDQAGTLEVLSDLRQVQRVIVGRDVTTEAFEPLVEHCGRQLEHNPSLAAIDAALLDLLGKSLDRPAWWLMGAEQSAPVECNATLVSGEPAAVAADAGRWAEAGFKTFKLKVGAGQDVAQVRAVREALGADARIRVDANGVWDQAEAVSKLNDMAQYGIELAEQPAPTLEEIATVRRQTDVTVVADESINDAADAKQAAREHACDATTVKLSKVGGTVEAREIASSMPAYLSSALDGPVGIAAAAHLAQVLPDAGYAHGLATERLFSQWPAAGATLDGPMLSPADAPGLGVEMDDAMLDALRIDVS